MNARLRTWAWPAAVAAACLSVTASAGDPAGPSSMDAYLWSNRPLVVIAPEAGHPLFDAQRRALGQHGRGLGERDMVLIEVAGPRVAVDGRPAPDLSAKALRARYGVGARTAVALLVGKDGGVKLRREGAISAETLFSTIDAMPMRRREMRERGKGAD